ncbi:MAG: bifunctional 5,10-methylenetetrahydrofolate dehydrogenase/5,10-methenyltetrahydrofolate cyclohydrolase [Chloroflexota bacterium]|nr:bifunctional 5,10-methylenetetrahydrofolate dehydrogenase/5,10-methenyltetrahydrofolate cyclohydrolase [Chloroflexota bacterium]
MPAQLLDGSATARAIRAEVAQGVAQLRAQRGVVPLLVTVMEGDDPAARSYVRSIARQAEGAGIRCRHEALIATAGDAALRATITVLNADPDVHGVIVQYPLPAPLTAGAVAGTLDPRKDVDGITPANAGALMLVQPGFVPGTPLGGLELLHRSGIDLTGLAAVVVGRSVVLGKPLALLLVHANATVTVCHTRTRDLAGVCRQADLLCAATGKAGLITADMIKPGAVVLDFGLSPGPEGKLVGDVDFAAASAVASWITPVPGGTGPMTAAVLLRNTLQAAQTLTGGQQAAG